LENLDDDDDDDDDVDISKNWDIIRENMKASVTNNLGYYELKQRKSWFKKEGSELLNQSKRLNCNGCRTEAKEMYIT
jgi:hypothetical protein